MRKNEAADFPGNFRERSVVMNVEPAHQAENVLGAARIIKCIRDDDEAGWNRQARGPHAAQAGALPSRNSGGLSRRIVEPGDYRYQMSFRAEPALYSCCNGFSGTPLRRMRIT